MQVHELLRHLAPCEKGKRLIIVNRYNTPLYDGTFTDNTLSTISHKGIATENVMLIKTGATYIKILSERL